MSQRRSTLPRPRRRALSAPVLAAVLVLVPGAAQAADGDETTPVSEATDLLPEGAGGPSPAADEPEPPSFEIPPELEDAFRDFADQAGISQECVDDVSAALEQIGRGLTTPPVPPADIAAQIQAMLLGLTNPSAEDLAEFGEEVAALTDPENNDVAKGLQALAAALQSPECQPKAPAPPGGGTPAKPTPSQAAVPTHRPPPPPPPAKTPHHHSSGKPVAYPGYAPTGAPAANDTTVPVAAIGGLVLLTGAGAAGYGWRRRAVRPRD